MIRTGAEYALYWLAVNHPEVIEDAMMSAGTGMTTNNQRAAVDVQNLLEEHKQNV